MTVIGATPTWDRPDVDDEAIVGILRRGIAETPVAGRRVLVIIPDGTRTAPLPRLFRLITSELGGQAAALDWLIALGTHEPMSREEVERLLGISPDEWSTTLAGTRVLNHAWRDPGALVSLGTIPASDVSVMSEGRLEVELPVRINRLALEYDLLLVCGPVFPHEVVGFSGGNKYLFPGISGPEVINISHWLGALVTSMEIIGRVSGSPVRRLIDAAAALVPTPTRCLALVTRPGSDHLAGAYWGTPEAAWAAAATLSSRVHVRWLEQPVERVLSLLPARYPDMWTGAKGMYKVEPIVADGGEVVVYGPHIREFSRIHGADLAKVGYHVRDYFLHQWDRFKDVPWAVLAHSTHLRGAGVFEVPGGERARITVSLATGIAEADCRSHNLGYRDPASIDVADWMNRELEGVLVVPDAGELLFRVGTPPEPLADTGEATRD